MIGKPFFSLGGPRLNYPVIQYKEKDLIKEIPLPEQVTLLLDRPFSPIDEEILKPGDGVTTGRKVIVDRDGGEFFISTVTGTVSDISEYIGYFGRSDTSISIKTEGKDTWDEEFKQASKTISSPETLDFLSHLPGNPDFASMIDPDPPVEAVVINGMDRDLLVSTNQVIVKTETENLKKGIAALKDISKGSQILLMVPPELESDAEETGAVVRVIRSVYPDSLPEMVMKKVFRRIVPAGKRSTDLGVHFVNAEAVAALGQALDKGKIPVDKTLTVINKQGAIGMIRVRIGTPVKEILRTMEMETKHGDRLVFGGPMKGVSIYTEEMPVLGDTDAVMLQDGEQIIPASDAPCINCGECVRACPAKIPVNMLVRVLENGLYEEAAEQYDLFSCIECGLCAYVCVARIPVFHYIMLGKYEFEKIRSLEESHA